MYKNYFLLAFTFLFLTSNAQEKDNHQLIIKSVNDYYSLATENIHLHFNKSVYLTNETIWFKGYIIDKKSNGLNYETTNVYIRILDQEDESAIFTIEIINTKDKSSNNNNNTIDKESITITAEGGKLLFQCDNTVGVQIKNCSGEGIKANNIKVFDSKNPLHL